MSNVIIVEDDFVISEGLKDIIQEIDKDITIKTTSYAEEALTISQETNIDAFFLDIQLKDYSGLKLAEQIRSMDKYKFTPIVFITSIPTREMMAFKEIHCYDYIIKPFEEKQIRDVFETIIKHGINKKEEAILKINQKTYTYILNQDDILYLESEIQKVKIVTIDETLRVSKYSLKELHQKLTKDFIRCHRGFILNKKHIQKIDFSKNIIFLKDNVSSIPLGRKFKEDFKEKLKCN